MYHIALADDHILIRQGLASLINSFANFRVLFEADNGKDLIDKLKPRSLPDLVLMDITMPEMDGYAATNWLRVNHPQVKVLALSVLDDENAIIRMLKSGAKGYLLKNAKPRELQVAMESILLKGYYFNDHVSSKVINSINKIGENHQLLKNTINLTERETVFLKLACTEKSYKEIADAMFVSPRTVESYRDNLFEKFGVNGRIGLVLFAIRNKLITVS